MEVSMIKGIKGSKRNDICRAQDVRYVVIQESNAKKDA